MFLLAALQSASEAQDPDWLSAHSTLVVSIVGIVVSGVFGPWVVGSLAAKRELRRDRRTLAIARRDDLRGLLDEAAVVLGAAVSHLRPLLAAQQNDEALPEGQKETLGSLKPLGQRICLRLDEKHEVVKTYEDACEALRAIQGETESIERWDAAVEVFETKRSAFMDAGRRAVHAPIKEDGER